MNGKLLKTVLATVIGSVLLTGCGSSSSDTKPASVVVNPISTPSNAKENGQPQANKENESTSETTTSSGSSENAAISTIALPETSNQPISAPTSTGNNGKEKVAETALNSAFINLFRLPSIFTNLSVETDTTAETKSTPPKEVMFDGHKVPTLNGAKIVQTYKDPYGVYWTTYQWINTGAYKNMPWKPDVDYSGSSKESPALVLGVDLSDLSEQDKASKAQEALNKIITDINQNSSHRTMLSGDEQYVLGYGINPSDSSKLPVKVGDNKNQIKVGSTTDIDLTKTVDVYSFINNPTESQFLLTFGGDSGSYLGGSKDKNGQTTLYAFGDKSTIKPTSDLSYRGTAVVKLNDKYHVGEFAGMIDISSMKFNGMIKGNGLDDITLNSGTVSGTTYNGKVTCTSCGENATYQGQLNGTANQGTTGVITDTSNKISGVFGGSKIEAAAK